MKKMKGKSGIDNPYALAWSMSNKGATPHYKTGKGGKPKLKKKYKGKQVVSGATLTQLLRPQESFSDQTGFALKEVSAGKLSGGIEEGRIFQVVLLTEGLGNRRNMNYYGPEAITSAPPIFEGKPCFLNHQSISEETDRPERRVEDKCGYFKNVQVIYGETGKSMLAGELHTDLSESGRLAAEKLLTSLHYQQEFQDGQYIGLSIAANGETEKRMVTTPEGEELEANYVLQFTEAHSCDLVTMPARGGQVMSLLESIASKEEKGMKTVSAVLESVLSDFGKIDKEKDEKKKKTISESVRRTIEGLMMKAKQAEDEDEAEDGEDGEDEGERGGAMCAKQDGESGEDEDDAKDDDGDGDGDGDGGGASGGVKPGHKVTKTTSIKHEKMGGGDDQDGEDEDEEESRRDALKSALKEAAIPSTLVTLSALMRLPYREAKAEILRIKALREAWKSDMSTMPAKGQASGSGKDNTSLFAECAR